MTVQWLDGTYKENQSDLDQRDESFDLNVRWLR